MKLFVRQSQIDVQRYSAETIKKWMCNVRELSKKVEKMPKNDIRRCIESQIENCKKSRIRMKKAMRQAYK